MSADSLLASIKPRAIEDIQIGDRTYTVDAWPAAEWLEVLLAEQLSLWDIIPGMIGGPEGIYAEEALIEALNGGSLGAEEYAELAYEVLTVAAGRPWWTAMRLCASAVEPTIGNWVRGQLVLHHIDATALSLSAWLDALYGIFTQHMDADRRNNFDAMLMRPLPGAKAKVNTKTARASFAAAMGS